MLKQINNHYVLVTEDNIPIAINKMPNEVPSEKWITIEEARIKYYQKKIGEEYANSLLLISKPLLNEAIYNGMLGLAELYKFHDVANGEDKKLHRSYMASGRYQDAWDLISRTLNIGKINADIYKVEPKQVNINTFGNPDNDNTSKFESLFTEFLSNILLEELHPELKDVVNDTRYNRASKQTRLVKKIKELSARGESTGIENNMPKGSSRAFLLEEEHHPITLDGVPTKIPVGTKVAITAQLDKFHNKDLYEGRSLGEIQQEAD